MINLHLLFSGFFLSFDSFIMSLALGSIVHSPTQRWRLAALFGVSDGLAVLVGSALGQGVWRHDVAHNIVLIYALAYGICCLVSAHRNKFRANPRLAFALPVLMSLDNLVYGVGAGPSTTGIVERATVLGLMSFSLAVPGVLLWNFTRLPDARIRECLAGCALVVACASFLFT
jgi:putative Mn2+ efflux pump MntP